MVEWLKLKHRSEKRRSRYGSTHNDSAKKSKKLGVQRGIPSEPPGERYLLIDGLTGKRHWRWR